MAHSRAKIPILHAVLAIVALIALSGAAALALRSDDRSAPASGSRERSVPVARSSAPLAVSAGRLATANDSESGPDSHDAEVAAAPSAETITYLAGNSEDPRVIEAALREVLSTYSSRSSQKRAPDAELDRVLIQHMRSTHPSVAAAALEAARIPLMTKQPSAELTRSIAELAAPEREPARRQAALEALDLIRPDRRAPHVLEAFERALASREPYLVSLALRGLSQSGSSLLALPDAPRTRIAERVIQLASASDPGVRGRALAVLAEIDALVSAATRLEVGVQRLRDAHPYVRAQAADLLLRCHDASTIHSLIALVGDLAEARYELSGFSRLDGGPGRLVHVVPGRQRVAEAALLSILPLSQNTPGVTPLFLTLGGRVHSETSVLENAERARAWYRAEAARIPRTPATRTE